MSYSSTTSSSSNITSSTRQMSGNMKSAAEPTRSGKRKGTRSVSTLTPSQLARKRANDREAQRAIRARTKEHIESLEREIDELKSVQNRDQAFQNMIRRIKSLEEENSRLRQAAGMRPSDPTEQYHHVFTGSSPPRAYSFDHSTPNYQMMQNLTYNTVPDAAGSWPPGVSCSLPSTASSPTSSTATDDFGGANYIPTSAPSVFERASLPPHGHSPAVSSVSGEGPFDDVKPAEFGCSQLNMMPISTPYQFQPWSMYAMPQYQSTTPPTTTAALSRSHPQVTQIGRCTF
ncbi:hypothetical protein M426DRAFT_9016 [Hypoxylon sp. CI-4A]|nr:hypothetical protein M426DRAFT_9016 [Hypoxylon sp. CI-4A]